MPRFGYMIPFVVLLLAAMLGCASTSNHLVRIHADDGRAIAAGLTYTGTGRGTVWVQFPDGKFLTGEFFTTSEQHTSSALLATAWGPITTVSMSQAGPEVSHFTAAGNRGTSFRCVSFPKGPHGVGGCRDSSGRQYKLFY